MTCHLYRRPDGSPEVASYLLPLEIFPGYEYIRSAEQRIELDGMVLQPDGELTPDLARAKELRKREVERERDRRVAAPVIAYDGKRLDADADSIERVARKLAALDAYDKCGETMPQEMLVWRDADNITHSFADQQEYKLWLAGFAVALDARGTAAFAWSWEKKAQVDAADDIAALQAVSLAD